MCVSLCPPGVPQVRGGEDGTLQQVSGSEPLREEPRGRGGRRETEEGVRQVWEHHQRQGGREGQWVWVHVSGCEGGCECVLQWVGGCEGGCECVLQWVGGCGWVSVCEEGTVGVGGGFRTSAAQDVEVLAGVRVLY